MFHTNLARRSDIISPTNNHTETNLVSPFVQLQISTSVQNVRASAAAFKLISTMGKQAIPPLRYHLVEQ